MYDQHVAYFSTKNLAEDFVRNDKSGWPKSIRQKEIYELYNVCESLEEKETLAEQVKKEIALGKLSVEERQLLGI